MESKIKFDCDDITNFKPPILVTDMFGTEYDIFKKYFELIHENDILNELKNEVKNLRNKKPCQLGPIQMRYDNYVNVEAEKIEEPNNRVEHASKKVVLRNTDNQNPIPNMQLFAVEKLNVNDILISEPPLVLQLVPTCACFADKNSLRRCHHCGMACIQFVKCKYCDIAIYCQENCLIAANNEYHKYECYGFQRHYWSMEKFDHSYLAMRMMFKKVKAEPPMKTWFPTLNTMWANFSNFSVNDVNRILYMVSRTIVYLMEFTTFLHYNSESLHQCCLKMGGVLLRSYCQAQTNVVYIDYPNHGDGYGFEVIGNTGKAICPSMSGLNHDCMPNATIVVYYNALVLRPIAPIEPGEAITVGYSEINLIYPLELRQEILLRQHFFQCDCWRCRKEFMAKDAKYRCDTCKTGGRVRYFDSDELEYTTCDTCRTQEPFAKSRAIMTIMDRAWETLDKTNIISNLELIVICALRVYSPNSWEILKVYLQVLDTLFACQEFDFSPENTEDIIVKPILSIKPTYKTIVVRHNNDVKDEYVDGFPPTIFQLKCIMDVLYFWDVKIPVADRKYLALRMMLFDSMLDRPIVCHEKTDNTKRLMEAWIAKVIELRPLSLIYVPRWNTRMVDLPEKITYAIEKIRYIDTKVEKVTKGVKDIKIEEEDEVKEDIKADTKVKEYDKEEKDIQVEEVAKEMEDDKLTEDVKVENVEMTEVVKKMENVELEDVKLEIDIKVEEDVKLYTKETTQTKKKNNKKNNEN